MSSSKNSKAAFTLIEVLVVISIIGIMSTMVFLDFSSARKRQNVSLIAEQSLALLQQSQAEVNAGFVQEDQLLCKGAYFEKGALPLQAQGIFDGEDCVDLETEAYGVAPADVEVAHLQMGALSMDALWVLFTPPDGHVLFYNDFQEKNLGSALIQIENRNQSDLHVDLKISQLTNQAFLITPDHEH